MSILFLFLILGLEKLVCTLHLHHSLFRVRLLSHMAGGYHIGQDSYSKMPSSSLFCHSFPALTSPLCALIGILEAASIPVK